MIVVKNLTKSYGNNCVLNNVSVTFSPGVIYGLIGTNGCGKTTLMRCICGFARPTAGTVTVMNQVISKDCDFAPSTGIILETPGFLDNLSGYKNLLLLSGISNKTNKNRIEEALRLVGLNPFDKKPVGKYSLGMRQRLGIAQAIMENPEVLILDEPFNGLDTQGQAEIHKLLQLQKQEGKIIILASHSASDIARACDVVFEIRQGALYRA